MKGQKGTRRSGLRIMGQLIGLVKPLLPVMLLAIFFGAVGYLCAISLTILAGFGVCRGLGLVSLNLGTLLAVLVAAAVARGLLHYGEQYCNHYIAFKLLATLRHRIFAALRRLCPAKLEGRDKGNLISLITTDIELLEVFYAHTISPIAIAILVSVLMVIFISLQSLAAGIVALCGYLTVGLLIPLWIGKRGGETGLEYQNCFGELNSFVLDSLYGLDETIQYGAGKKRLGQITDRSDQLGKIQKRLNRLEATQRSATNLAILAFSFGMLFLMTTLCQRGQISFQQALIATVSMMGSFGPVTALASLANNLNHTLASGERVLSLLEEEPQVEEIVDGKEMTFTGAAGESVDFSYGHEQILRGFSIDIPKGTVVGIHGASGSGKSTLLKLLMRFWDVDAGQIKISGQNIRGLNTANLRSMEAYVTQETWLFHDTIANNIAVGKPGAAREEIAQAAQKASIHDFIQSLPQGYDTPVGELGDTLSGGERQRIGIARMFLSDGAFWLMDEPTSNLDALNEGIILKSLKEQRGDKTILLVSHRKSTMNAADVIYPMDNGRIS